VLFLFQGGSGGSDGRSNPGESLQNLTNILGRSQDQLSSIMGGLSSIIDSTNAAAQTNNGRPTSSGSHTSLNTDFDRYTKADDNYKRSVENTGENSQRTKVAKAVLQKHMQRMNEKHGISFDAE